MTDDLARLRTECMRLRSALHDRITGLPAIPALFDELRRMLDARRAIGLLHIVVPNIAFVESVYGWQTFDRIVGEQAALLGRLRGSVLPEGAPLAQTGIHGEEMIAIVEEKPDRSEVDAAHLHSLASAVEKSLQELFATDAFATIAPRLEARAGHAILSENPFYRFERLVYRAIEDARERARRREERHQRSWGAEIRQVIRDESIVVHFQPVVALDTLEVLGYEALSRGPEGSGLESPAVLFAHSRDAGLVAELDRLCRRAALASARGAFDKASLGGKRKIFVNTSAEHLADPDWQDGGLERTLESLGLAPEDLVVEFPQTRADSEDAALERAALLLRQRGFQLSIDDIGTGYAGLRTIERIRPHYLKIDIALVRNIASSLIQQDVLGSLVAMSSRLDSAVVAEGIESSEELEFLKTHGARYGQGFLFSGAMPQPVPGPIVLGRDH